jgi:Ca2+-binding RTX toxin-like protein
MNTYLQQSLEFALNNLSQSAHQADFWSGFALAFGSNYDHTPATAIRQAAIDKTFQLPIQVVPDIHMGAAIGAFSTDRDTIYLSQSLVDSGDIEQISAVILEEMGHAIDVRVNAQETPGDEGAIFQLVARGQEISRALLAMLRAEDDWGVISIDGQQLLVEMAATAGNDTLTGTSGDDNINGLAGNDIISGGLGTDVFIIDADVDLGADTIVETATGGVDTIDFRSTTTKAITLNLGVFTSHGNDSLNGGIGLDTFYFTGAALTSLNTVGTILGTDTIADFTVGVDKIALSKATFSALSGALGTITAADFAVVANDSLAGGSAAAIVYSTGSGKLFYNADRANFDTVPPLNTPINSGLGYSGGNFAVLPAIGAVYPTLSAANFTIIA